MLPYLIAVVIGSIVLVAVDASTANAALCLNHYPAGETAVVLEKIVEQYAEKQLIMEENGYDRSVLVIEREEFVVDAQRYSVQPAAMFVGSELNSATCTFRFESHRYFRNAIFVRADRSRRSLDVDAIEPFNRLHFICPIGTKCCGLFCCPNETKVIQEKLIERADPMTDDSSFRVIDPSATITFRDIAYSLSAPTPSKQHKRTMCMYALKEEDKLYQKTRWESGEPLRYIFYTCPSSQVCCQLRCVPVAQNSMALTDSRTVPPSELVRARYLPSQARVFQFETFDYILMTISGSLILLIVVVCVLFVLRLKKAGEQRRLEERLRSYEEQEKMGAFV